MVEATVGPQRGEQTSKHDWNIVRKTNTNRAGFRQIFNLQHVNERRGKSSIETGCVGVQSRRYQSYTWKEGVEGGMGTKEASWERIGGT